MAARKSKAPAALEGADADGGESQGAGGEAAGTEGSETPVVPPTTEESIRQAADRKLEERTGDQAVQLSKAVAKANALEGELKKERSARAGLEQQVADLTAALAAANTAAKQAGQAIAGLPANARQLNESVTAHTLARGGTTPRRANLKATDVLLVTEDDDEVDELQRELGLQATVYKVSKKTLEDLEQSGFLHK